MFLSTNQEAYMPKTALGGLAAKLAQIRNERSRPQTASSGENNVVPDEPLSLDLLVGGPPEDSDEDEIDPLAEFREIVRSEEEDFLDGIDPDSLPSDPEDEASPVEPEGNTSIVPGEVLSSNEREPDSETLLQLFEAYYKINRYPSDAQFHSLAESLGVSHDRLEEALFALIGDAIADESVGSHNVG
jgi:hypothetical protein